MKSLSPVASAVIGLVLAASAAQVHAAGSFTQGFNGTVIPTGWLTTNLSTRASTGSLWSVGPGISDGVDIVVGPQEGNGFAIVNYTSIGSGTGTINNWLISPEIFSIKNGDKFSFFTTTTPESAYPDRLEFRLSTAGAGTNVGSSTTSVGTFTTTLLSINPTLAGSGYPETWTQYTATVSGLAGPADGRVAFRYFVTSAGPTGANSNIIGVDSFSYAAVAAAVPEASTWILMSAGLAGLIGIAGVRRKAASAS